MSTVDEWINRLASDDYPFDTVVHRVMVLAQEHGVDFGETLRRVASARIPAICERPGLSDPLLWTVVSASVKLGDDVEWQGSMHRAYSIHTDQHGIRRARVAPRYHYNGEPHVDTAETHDERRTVNR